MFLSLPLILPSSDYLNGWVCFWTSIVVIGLLTAIIGDLSSHLGCSVGLKDTITAIAFVALGTSIPGKWLFFVNLFSPFFRHRLMDAQRWTLCQRALASESSV